SRSGEASVILGAAVIDDVLGLVTLGVVTAVITAAADGRAVSYGPIGLSIVKTGFFLFGSLALGIYLSPHLFSLASKLESEGDLLAIGLVFCFFFSLLAAAIDLAPIVGAFGAGLILENPHYRDFLKRGERSLPELVEPISSFLVPVFFVLVG